MKTGPASHSQRRGLSLIEVALIAVIVTILSLAILPALYALRTRASPMSCANHLKSVSLAFRLYATDHGDRFPAVSTNGWQTIAGGEREFLGRWRLLSNDLGSPKLLVCPSDRRSPAPNFSALAASNVSYFLNADGRGQAAIVLLGDRHLAIAGQPVPPGVLTLNLNLNLGWTPELHLGRGHLSFGDGSVQAFAVSPELTEALRPAIREAHRLFVP
ncbi:MAG: hypothetical protein IPM17_10320 [Verrucomicrobia bacterium]|jgi:competence protein ComGC|nr:hypothetical protein [Verrucomicrobiota bacterium]